MSTSLAPTIQNLGNIVVRRILPNKDKKMIGPFIFFDHFGPANFAMGDGLDIGPHPHIGLATVSYLITGSMLHRDSLGNVQEIKPGDMNWMTAGSGIVHSERETLETRASEHALEGLQLWVALPREYAEVTPNFCHLAKEQLPSLSRDGLVIRLLAGSAFGMSVALETYSPLFYLDIVAKGGTVIKRPNPEDEALLYIIAGEVNIDGVNYPAATAIQMNATAVITATTHCRCVILGGPRWEDTPYAQWNYVSFSRERINKAKQGWDTGQFPTIPNDPT